MTRIVNAWRARAVFVLYTLYTMTAIVLPAQTLTTLFSFNGTDGIYPNAVLVQGTDGNFYGTTGGGGTTNSGTVFKITPSGVLTTLYSFCVQTNCTDGEFPEGLVEGTDGNFYGITNQGGAHNAGTIFKITPSGTLTTLYSFGSQSGDGESPEAALVQGTDGNFYGTTEYGGASFGGSGTVFKITPSGTLTTLYSFCSQPNCADGYYPRAALVQGTDGNFYGTTAYGGTSVAGGGTVFKITPGGTLTTLYSFCSQPNCSDGEGPVGALVQGADGDFYGTTGGGGANAGPYGDGGGTVFKITPSGTLTTLYSFCSQANCSDGGLPDAALVQATDGNFYGTTISGGVGDNQGTIFKITPSGALTTLYSFFEGPSGQGVGPGGLIQGNNGDFYGTTETGGSTACNTSVPDGTIFSLSLGGIAASVAGQITVSSGGLLSEAIVTLAGTQCGATPTDGAGDYSFGIPAGGSYTVTPSQVGYVFSPPSQSFNSLSGNQTANFTATPLYTISGQVTLSGTGWSGFTVSLSGSQSGSTTTNSSGSYTFIVPAGGSYTVTPVLNGCIFTPPSQSFSSLNSNQSASFNCQSAPTCAYSVAPTSITVGPAGGSGNITVTTQAGCAWGAASNANWITLTPSGVMSGTATVGYSTSITNSGVATRTGTATLANQTVNFTQTPGCVVSLTPAFGNSFNGFGASYSCQAQTIYLLATPNDPVNCSAESSSASWAPLVCPWPGLPTTINGGCAACPANPLGYCLYAQCPYNCSSFGLPPSTSFYVGIGLQANTGPQRTTSMVLSGASVELTQQAANQGATYTISGQASLNGSALSGVSVTLSGSQSDTAAASYSGYYSFTLPAGGSYTVTPSLAGYTFDPPSRTFNTLSANEVANFSVGAATQLLFISMPPCRVVDTRDATKPSGFGPPSLGGGTTRSFAIPSGSCGIPATAQAYSLNVTVVPEEPLSYLTVSHRPKPALRLDAEFARWRGPSQRGDRASRDCGRHQRVCHRQYKSGAGYQRVFRAQHGFERVRFLSDGALQARGHAAGCAVHHSHRIFDRRDQHHAADPVQQLQCAGDGGGIFVELHFSAAGTGIVSDGLPDRRKPAGGIHHERPDRDGCGKRGDRAGRHRRKHRSLCDTDHQPGGGYQRVLRARSGRRAVAVCAAALPGAGHAHSYGIAAFRRRHERECDRERLRGNQCSAGVCVQRHGGTGRPAGLLDIMAARKCATSGIDVERGKWRYHQQHGHRAHQQHGNQRLRQQHHVFDSRSVRVFCAIRRGVTSGSTWALSGNIAATVASYGPGSF